jgi:CheY-like chemotaxis protein
MSSCIRVAEDDPKQAPDHRVPGAGRARRTGGRTTLELARTRRPDLIVLEVMMPQVAGLDVCHILGGESQVPILLLSAHSTEADMLLGLDLGADDYMNKPFSPPELTARYGRCCAGWVGIPTPRVRGCSETCGSTPRGSK